MCSHVARHRTVSTSGLGAGALRRSGFDDAIYQRLLRERIIFLGSVVEDQMANAIAAQILLLAAEDAERDIFLYINSPGGSVSAGMAIYDTMQFVKNDVATVGMGLAASMGQFLLCAGAEGKRYALPHARIMMHQPSGGIGGTASDIKIQAEQMLYTKKKMAELIAEHTGQTWKRSRRTPIAIDGSPPMRRRSTDSLTRLFAAPATSPAREEQHERASTHRRVGRARLRSMAPSARYIVPEFRERGNGGIERNHNPYTKLFEERIIFLGVQIDDTSADDVMAQLLCLEQMDPDRDISIYINSPGGSYTAMTAIYDTMQFVKPQIQTVCLGQAASAAAVLLAAGTSGEALRPATCANPDPPALQRGSGSGLRHRDSGERDSAYARLRWRHHRQSLRQGSSEQIRKDIERDKILTAASGRRSTASSIRSSSPARSVPTPHK